MVEKVSIFMPVYNQKNLVVNTIESILSQSFQDYKMIIGDDCSTDGTVDVLKSYQEKYPDKIKLLLNKKNLGITDNCNYILKNCKGEYIAFLSGDDLMHPTKLEKQVALMDKNPDASMCYHDIDVFDVTAQKTLFIWSKGHNVYSGDIVEKLILNSCFICGCSLLARTNKIPTNGYDAAIAHAADYLFFIEIAKNGKALYIDEVLGKYVRHGNNITEQFTTNSEIKCLHNLIKKYPEYAKIAQKSLSATNFICFLKQIRHNRQQAFAYFKDFLKTCQSLMVFTIIGKRLLNACKRKL